MSSSPLDPAVPDSPAGAPTPVVLREPAHRVSPRAQTYWRTTAALGWLLTVAVIGVVWLFWDGMWPWLTVVAVLIVVAQTVEVIVEPWFKFRVHRWEVDDVAVYTRQGWLNLETKIAPLSRVQTVEFVQGALMRVFDVASLTVTTASAAGPITIEGLDAQEAKHLVARLTAITGADHGDAT